MNCCKIKDCPRPAKAKGMCVTHYYGEKRGVKKYRQRLNESHGMHNTREYRTWDAMIRRCHSGSNDSFDNYGARGITVCEEWRYSFLKFFLDMGEKPDGLDLDRIDNSKGYSSENCRWATRQENIQNTRVTKLSREDVIKIRKSKEKRADIAAKFGIALSTVYQVRARDRWSNVK